GGPRSIGILAVAHAIGFDIEVVEANPQDGLSEEYLKLNRLGKTPTFVSSDGTVLTECMAIALHVASQDTESSMLGSGHMDFINIVSWMSLCNSDVFDRLWRARFPCFTAWFEMITNLEMYRAVIPDTVMVDTAIGPPNSSMRSDYVADD
ncbi:unnamed protein product, partial [Aureobasidium vineae]